MTPRRGEVWLGNLDPAVGEEMEKPRPRRRTAVGRVLPQSWDGLCELLAVLGADSALGGGSGCHQVRQIKQTELITAGMRCAANGVSPPICCLI